jgi:O-antigen/teichoic acid export membrane protein
MAISVLLLVGVPLFYGDKFSDTTLLGFVLLPGVLLLGISRVLSFTIQGRGYPRYVFFVGAVTVPLTLALYFTLIPAFNAWGAATASSISYALTTGLMLFFFRRVTRISVRRAFVPRGEDFTDYVDLARLARGSWLSR